MVNVEADNQSKDNIVQDHGSNKSKKRLHPIQMQAGSTPWVEKGEGTRDLTREPLRRGLMQKIGNRYLPEDGVEADFGSKGQTISLELPVRPCDLCS